MAAIRFKWTVREDNGDYYVDETFGENSAAMVTGPMTRDAAIQMVDDREAEARRRFEQLKAKWPDGVPPPTWPARTATRPSGFLRLARRAYLV